MRVRRSQRQAWFFHLVTAALTVGFVLTQTSLAWAGGGGGGGGTKTVSVPGWEVLGVLHLAAAMMVALRRR